jgi:hypothetical protein
MGSWADDWSGAAITARFACVRIVTGSAVYTEPFSPSTTPLGTSTTGQTQLLLRAVPVSPATAPPQASHVDLARM